MPWGQATSAFCNVAIAGSSLNPRALATGRRGEQSTAELGLQRLHLHSTKRRCSLILSMEPVCTDRGWGLRTQVYSARNATSSGPRATYHWGQKYSNLPLPCKLYCLFTPDFHRHEWNPCLRDLVFEQSRPGVSLPRPSSLALFQTIYIQFLHGPISGLPTMKEGTLPCRGRLRITIVGHVLSKRGAGNPEDVLGAFLEKLTYTG